MPRTRRQVDELQSESESDDDEAYQVTVKYLPSVQPLLAKQWGADQWFDMCKATGKTQECSICLESCLECKMCLAVLVPCMHTVHYRCLFSMDHPECPICRPSNTTST